MSSCNFLEVCRDVTKTARKIPQSDYLSQGNYKIFDQGKQYIAGYTNDSEGIVSDYPYIVFGDHTRILKFVAEPCFIGADGVKLLKVYNEDFTPQYVYYALLAQPIENQGYSRHFKYLKELNIAIYTKEEQNAIVSELDKIQAALDNKKEQLKKLDELIQSKFYEMFGDPVVNDKGWNKETIKKIGRVVTGNTPSRNVESYYNKKFIEWIKTDNIIKGRMYPSEAKEYLSEEGMMKARVVDEDSILVTCIAGSISSIGGCCLADRKVAFNQQINAIVPNKDIDSKFLYYYIMLSKELIRNKASQGMKHIISKSSFEELPIILPPLPLQQAFAAYVEKVEQAKAIVNQEIAHLQELLNSRMDFYFRK